MNSHNFVFLWLGLWSIGAKPAFINYNLVGKALEHCVSVSTARLLVVDAQLQDNITDELRATLTGVQFEIFDAFTELEALSTVGVRQPDSCRSEDKAQNMACLIYTSGTTGLPKPAIVGWWKVTVGSIIMPRMLGIKTTDIVYTVSVA